ncbi:hypothetical protein Hanom_Chr16g01431281 [Helianthus anomalus]
MDSDSEAGSADMEEMEEGEIRQNLDNVDRRQDEDTVLGRSENIPVDNEQSMDNQQSVEAHGFSTFEVDQNSKSLHAEVVKSTHVEGDNDVVNVHVDINSADINGGPNFRLNDTGPTLGPKKRNREDRSPPSIGSTQGPTQRIYNQPNRPSIESLDLNIPVRDRFSTIDENVADFGIQGL